MLFDGLVLAASRTHDRLFLGRRYRRLERWKKGLRGAQYSTNQSVLLETTSVDRPLHCRGDDGSVDVLCRGLDGPTTAG